MLSVLSPPLMVFAEDVCAKLNLAGSTGEPEEQLRTPLENFLRAAGEAFQMRIILEGEARVQGVGRPDYAVYSNGALCGYIELKQLGKGADPNSYSGHDARQWSRFKGLPNILYSDGNEWGLYQNGERIAPIVRLDGDMAAKGKNAISEENATRLEPVLREFLTWNPVIPPDAAGLAALLAPICRLLRQEVEETLAGSDSPFHLLLGEWQTTLFPGASAGQFADAYAQTVTFALLLANAEGANTQDLREAENTLAAEHALLAKALKIFTDNLRPAEKPLSLGLLQRITAQIAPGGWKKGGQDPWLYFYEDFLAAYDPQLRRDSGSYYTPVDVVQAMTRLTEDILINRLHKAQGFASPSVMTLDPAVGTGTFPLGIISHSMQRIAETQGPGAAVSYAETLARQLHGFEIQVGPYAVAQLRLSRALNAYGASLPPGGPQVYLTDTLESPQVTPQYPSLMARELSEQHKKALELKNNVPVLVCIGNPPYDRHEAADGSNRKATGGWVRWGDEDEEGAYNPDRALLASFIRPVRDAGQGSQLKNLYNLYVYFWRWAIWKVLEQQSEDEPGIIAFITASSFLDGPAFCGMREHLRRRCHAVWIMDLGGEGRGSRREENIFNIQTPVAITIAVKYGKKDADIPAEVSYCRIRGTQTEKLSSLRCVENISSLSWEVCTPGWRDKFIPQGQGEYFSWPLLTDIFPWQHSGVQFKRTWPIAHDSSILNARWHSLFSSVNMAAAFKETRDRKVNCEYPHHLAERTLTALSMTHSDTPHPEIIRYGYRSFDRQWCFMDNRLGDYLRPVLSFAHSERQLYFASIFTQPLGNGPALTLSAAIPDLHYFSGRGAKDIFPLYRNAAATLPNILPGLLEILSAEYGQPVSAEDFVAYTYAVLAHLGFTSRFHTELASKEIRLPLTRDVTLFARAIATGRRLIWLHSYGERLTPGGARCGEIPTGVARCVRAVPGAPEGYPTNFSYNDATQTLHVGTGEFTPVSYDVFSFEVSGLKVVQSWLKYRMKGGAGRRSSPLDDIRPERWTAEFTTELLKLLWILEATLAGHPAQDQLLEDILSGSLFLAEKLPEVPESFRRAPERSTTRFEQLLL
jgi:hypothetical protein